jgi:CRISPR-associated endonuclease/helicase Cas3
MKSFNELLSQSCFNLLENLDRNDYVAHLSKGKIETLNAHTKLVMKYFLKILEANKLENNIDNLIKKEVLNFITYEKTNLLNYLKTLFAASLYFHDFGKINPNFQREKMNNQSFPLVINGIGSDHSILSFYLYLAYFIKDILNTSLEQIEKNFLITYAFVFSHSIYKHHSSLDDVFNAQINDILLDNLFYYYQCFKGVDFLEKDKLKNVLKNADEFGYFKKNKFETTVGLIILKLNSSLLTASDYLATTEFMLGLSVQDYGIMNDEIRSKTVKNVYNIHYNKQLIENFEYFKNLPFEQLNEVSNENLNLIRQKLAAEVITNYRENANNKLFYVEAPTGSGKTNLSLLLISEILKNRDNIKKIFYVFPFVSLITQTFTTIKNNLKLSDAEITQIHSKAPFEKDRAEDDFYGSLKKNYIDALFVNFPIVLMSHIKFFNSIVSNEKEENYLLHRLANSIVIIDELQSYTPSEWDKLNYFINTFSDLFNITFVLMSATLPKISQLIIGGSNNENQDNFIYLVQNKDLYFTNPNFSRRVSFNFDLLAEGSIYSNENLAEFILDKANEYYNLNGRVLTLVEFITKKSANSFYNLIKSNSNFSDFEIIYIDGTVLEPRRSEIIKYLKSTTKNGKLLLIATQVIEAGLDIDMDIGFKDISLIDSDEQFAGRINRNASKTDCCVYLFDSGNAKFVYKDDLRFDEQKKIDRNQLNEILISKKFDKYYSLVFTNINSYNNQIFAENLSSFLQDIKLLKYKDVKKKFKLIDNNTISIFVPLKIPIRYFSDIEIAFLKDNQIYFDDDEEICGEKLFSFYEQLIKQDKVKEDFLKNKAEFKIINTIMSQFVFSMYFNINTNNKLKNYGEFKNGFFYLTHWEQIYTYEYGLDQTLEINNII